eukprot:scaffold29394_cov112-Isochrysis_galbana.AAC.1
MKAQRGRGSDRACSATWALAEKKVSAIAHRMGTARQLPPEKMRSWADGQKAWRSTGASAAACAPPAPPIGSLSMRLA